MIYCYDMGFDLDLAPFEDFSLSLDRVSTPGPVTITAAELIAAADGRTKAMTLEALVSIASHNPLSAATIDDDEWATFSFFTILDLAAYTLTSAAGWGIDVLFEIDEETGLLTIFANPASEQIKIVVNNSATEYILGHLQTNNAIGCYTREGACKMQFLTVPTVPYSSNDSGLYEAQNRGSLAIPTAEVIPYGWARGASRYYHDYSHVGLTKDSAYGNGTNATGFKFFFAWVAQGYPFAAIGDDSNSFYYLRQPDGVFKPKRMIVDYDELWEVELKLLAVGQK